MKIKTTDKIRLVIFATLFALLLTNLFMINRMNYRLASIENRMPGMDSQAGGIFTQRMEPQYLIAPPKEGGRNPYYEGFFRDYGDNEFHPHRQALMLLLSHLGAQGERPAKEISPEKLQIEVKKPR